MLEIDVESEESESQILEFAGKPLLFLHFINNNSFLDPDEQWDILDEIDDDHDLTKILKNAETTILDQKKKIDELEDTIHRLKSMLLFVI
jgi:hypothetical protein